MEHIYDFRKRDFFSFNDIINLYDIPKHYFLFYNTLVSSISSEWKYKLKTEIINIPRKETLLIKSLKKKHVNKYLYERQFQNAGKMDVKQEKKWEDILNDTVLDWKNIYLTPIKSTIDTILRDFQYKFLMQIIPTNSFLLKCKISNTNLCDFCNRNIETVKHLFWECHHSQHFWSQLKTFLLGLGILIELNYELIYFGKLNVLHKQQLLN